MKIIKEGDPERIHRYVRFECKGCGCIFDADQREYDNLGVMVKRGGNHTMIYVSHYNCECPSCGWKVHVRVESEVAP